MSTYVRLSGYYVKATVRQLQKLGYCVSDDPNDSGWSYLDKDKLNEWVAYRDYYGTPGLVYLVDYEWDAIQDLEFYETTISKPAVLWAPGVELDEAKFFLINYYNGSDNPLVFK